MSIPHKKTKVNPPTPDPVAAANALPGPQARPETLAGRSCDCTGTAHKDSCKLKRGVRSKRTRTRTTDQERARDQRRAWRKAYSFSAVDGEAIGDQFVLLGCSDGTSIENPEGLRTFDCLQFLTTREHDTLWGFAFDYDVNQIMAGLTVTQLKRLAMTNKTFYGEFRIEHIPSKMLRITNRDRGRTVTVWDAFSFVQTSFARWLEDWKLIGPGDLGFIQEMKAQRPTFGAEQLDEIRRYCFMELDYLERGVKELIERVERTGIKPASWFSPGSISAAAMKKFNVLDHFPANKPNPEILAAAKSAYYGGRFEARILGEIPGPLFHYDINSAYPSAMVQLPCLACGSWEPVRSVDLDEPGNLVRITWRKLPFSAPSTRGPWGPFPVRVSVGSLRYPIVQDRPSWYWSDEVSAALSLTNVKVHAAYRFKVGCDHQPFAWLRDLYQKRQELKAAGDQAQYVYKLIINSAYGKLAQRPRRGRVPRFNQPLWSGRITALCRAQMLGAMAQAPDAIIQTATDGLTSFEKLDLPLSKSLGDWDVKELEKLFIVQSGIYFWKSPGGSMVQRSRGFHPSALTYEYVLDQWHSNPGDPMALTRTMFVGYRSALHRGRLDQWRNWIEQDVRFVMSPEPRRESAGYENGYLMSVPPVRAEATIMDQVFDQPSWDEIIDLENEQPDGPEGAGF